MPPVTKRKTNHSKEKAFLPFINSFAKKGIFSLW